MAKTPGPQAAGNQVGEAQNPPPPGSRAAQNLPEPQPPPARLTPNHGPESSGFGGVNSQRRVHAEQRQPRPWLQEACGPSCPARPPRAQAHQAAPATPRAVGPGARAPTPPVPPGRAHWRGSSPGGRFPETHFKFSHYLSRVSRFLLVWHLVKKSIFMALGPFKTL